MHLLHLLRHAKSSRHDNVEDHDRPLNRRGREAARFVGQHLAASAGTIDLVLCSSAARTRETLDLVLTGFAPRPRCLIEDELYLASGDELAARLQRLPETDANVMLIGHNPGLHDLAVALADPDSAHVRSLGKLPTAARVSFRVETPWSGLGDRRHQLIDYVTAGSPSGG